MKIEIDGGITITKAITKQLPSDSKLWDFLGMLSAGVKFYKLDYFPQVVNLDFVQDVGCGHTYTLRMLFTRPRPVHTL